MLRPLMLITLFAASVATSRASAATGSTPAVLLEQLQGATGARWETLRDSLLARGPELRAALAPRLAEARWSEASWRADLSYAALEAWRTSPKEASRIFDLPTLNPAVYLATRKQHPTAAKALLERGVPAPFLLELYTRTFETYPFSKAADFPRGLRPATIEAHREAERRALRDALLFAIGRSEHPAARFVLQEALQDSRLPEATRALAAESLGGVAHPAVEARLVSLAADRSASLELRGAALAGLGRVPSRARLAHLSSRLDADDSLVLRQASLAALGQLSSSWALASSTTPDAANLRAAVAERMVEAIARPNAPDSEVRTATEALTLTAWGPALEALAARRAGSSGEVATRLARAESRLARAIARSSSR